MRASIAQLVPYARNPRLHTPEQIGQIAASMREFGQAQLVVIDPTGEIIAGHGRVLAAERLGWSHVKVGVAVGWSEEQKQAYRIADNQLGLTSTWDMGLLGTELHDLKVEDYDLSLLGFDAPQLYELMADAPVAGADPESTPELPKEPIVKRGELWLLGGHRILCGDATSQDDVARLMDGNLAVLMNTDPPYGVNYGDIANSRSRAASKKKGGNGKDYGTHRDMEMENDDLDGAALQSFLEQMIKTAIPHLIERPAFYLWHPMLTQGAFFAAAAAAADILIHRQIIWVKPSLIMGRGDYHWRHELCYYGWVRGKHCKWLSGRDQDTVWQVGRENDHIHPTQKPTELFVRPINNHTLAGEFVYEPFAGSGSQIIAAEMTARRCMAMEIEAKYVEVCIERWQTFTGKRATLDGRAFDDVKRERETKEKAPRKRGSGRACGRLPISPGSG